VKAEWTRLCVSKDSTGAHGRGSRKAIWVKIAALLNADCVARGQIRKDKSRTPVILEDGG